VETERWGGERDASLERATNAQADKSALRTHGASSSAGARRGSVWEQGGDDADL